MRGESGAPRRSQASPLSIGELTARGSPLAGAAYTFTRRGNEDAKGRPAMTRGRCATRSAGGGAGAGNGAMNVRVNPSQVMRGPAGTTYAVRGGQHPLFTGSSRNTSPIPQQQHHRRTSPPSGNAQTNKAAAAASLMISAANSTVRPLRSAAVNAISAAALPGAARRKSVIESVAAATGVENAQSGRQHQQMPPSSRAGTTSHGSTTGRLEQPDGSDDARARVTASHTLQPLAVAEALKMRLLTSATSANGEGSRPAQRLPDDTLVMAPPERAKPGSDNAMYAQLASFRMPDDGNASTTVPAGQQPTPPPPPPPPGVAAEAAASAPPPPVNVAATTDGTTAPLPPAVPGAAATTAADPLAPPPAQTATAAAATPAGTAQPPAAAAAVQDPPKQADNAPGASTATPLPLHASAREPTTEERRAAAAERLVADLLHSLHSGDSTRVDRDAASHALMHLDSATATGMAALYVQRHVPSLQQDRSGLFGWQRPPANVLLPDPTQQASTWTLISDATAQEAQQAAAVTQARAEAIGTAKPYSDTHALRSGGGRGGGSAALRRGPAAAAAVVDGGRQRCADYHAPFQSVLQPERLEAVDAIPDISGAVVVLDTGLEAETRNADGTAVVQHPFDDDENNSSADGGMHSGNSTALLTDAYGTTVKSFASQAVVLRDPLSLLASEHLAEDTVDMVARRRAYLSAMAHFGTAASGAAAAAVFPPMSPAMRHGPSMLHSVLQPAAPPGEVFCTLSYQAKVLLSTILYLRALGALPTLLRVGPLTEYSPIVDKENCIELVFYNPSEDERRRQEAQEAQQVRRRRQSRERQRSAAEAQASRAPSYAATLSPSAAQSRPRGHSPLSDNGRDAPRFRSRSLPLTTSRTHTARTRSADDVEESVHLLPSASFSSRSPLGERNGGGSPRSSHGPSSPTGQLQRKQSAVEGLLMQSLTSAAQRRSASIIKGGGGAAAAGGGVLQGATSFTSLAGPQLRSAEPSFLVEDSIEVATAASGVFRRPTFHNEGGGAWLQRSPSQDAAARVRMPRSSGFPAEGPQQRSISAPAGMRMVERQRRGSECCSGVSASGIPHVSGERRGTATPVQPDSPVQGRGMNADAAAAPNAALRRSSVQFAVEDLTAQQKAKQGPHTAGGKEAAVAAAAASPTSLHAEQRPAPPFSPSVRFEATLDEVTAPPRMTAEADARATRPAAPHGVGKSRFLPGERELCVVLRAVVAQKSRVYAFGKAETVHVLPPLPHRTEDDAVDEDALLRTQLERKKSAVDRLSRDANNPLVRFLCGGGLRSGSGKEESEEATAQQRRATLRERARRASVAARRHGPVPVDAEGRHTVDDYGDLVVAFVLSKHASELSGSVPDMMELETLRYRIFSLQGYNSSDPSGMQAARAAATAVGAAEGLGAGAGGIASLPLTPSVDLRSSSFANFARKSVSKSSFSAGDAQARLQHQLSSYTAFQNNPVVSSPLADGRGQQSETPFTPEASFGLPRSSVRGLNRRASFFETALRNTDSGIVRSLSNEVDVDRLSDSDLQALRQRQHQQRRAAMRLHYPLYRASSVAESTLDAFAQEAKAAVLAARRGRRPSASPQGRAGTSRQGNCESKENSGELLAGLGLTSAAANGVRGENAQNAAGALLQEAERDLLRFRPMNMNSFHRELVDAVQYALDIQTRQKTEKALDAFHM